MEETEIQRKEICQSQLSTPALLSPAAGRTHCTWPTTINSGLSAFSWQAQAGGDTWEGRKSRCRDPSARGPASPIPQPPRKPFRAKCFQPHPAQLLHQDRRQMPKRTLTAKTTIKNHQSPKGRQHHENEDKLPTKETGPKEWELIEQSEQSFTACLPGNDESCGTATKMGSQAAVTLHQLETVLK